MKQYIFAGLAAVLMAGGLTAAAAPANAGCLDPGPDPLAQMCDSPVDADGMWERCLTSYPGGPLNPAVTECNTMSANDPPGGDPALSNPPTHIDP